MSERNAWDEARVRSFLSTWWSVFGDRQVTALRIMQCQSLVDIIPETITGRSLEVAMEKTMECDPALWSLVEARVEAWRPDDFWFEEDLSEVVGVEWACWLRRAARVVG